MSNLRNTNHFVPSNIIENSKLKQVPLCTVMLTFSDNQNRDVTSAYAFTTTTPQLYPQTRKTLFQNAPANSSKKLKQLNEDMSLSSTPFSTDDERYNGFASSILSSQPKNLVQEVSLSYSAPYTSTIKPWRSDENPMVYSPYISESEYGTSANTPFVDSVPYFSAKSALKAGKTLLSCTPPVTPNFEKNLTTRSSSALSQSTIVLESSTFEEVTTTITSNTGSIRNKETVTEMPTVNALAKQFEATALKEKNVSAHSRNISSPIYKKREKSKSRVVVIDRQQNVSKQVSNWPALVYSPGGILTTTIVDIEPVKFGAKTAEYKFQEEYIVRKYDSREEKSTAEQKTDFGPSQRNNDQQYSNKKDNQHRDDDELRVDTSPIDHVKNVVGRFETEINGVAYMQEKQLRSISRIDMNENNSMQEKVIIHQRSHSHPSERLIPIYNNSDNQKKEILSMESHTMFKNIPSEQIEPIEPIQSIVGDQVLTNESNFSPLFNPTPLPTADISEETVHIDNSQDVATETVNLEHSSAEITKNFDEKLPLVEEKFDRTVSYVNDILEVRDTEPISVETKERNETKNEDHYLQNFLDRDWRIKTYEEWSSTSRRRDRSEPPKRRSPTLYSSMSNRSKSNERTWEARFGGCLSRAHSEGRGIANSAYGGLISGNLVSGMSSAGAICTSQIRDAREREKREIGLLNDRLADYIEKVRFLEAQNQCLSHDIDILRRGFSGGGHVSGLFDTEIVRAKQILDQTIAGRAHFERDITSLSADIDGFKKKWIDSIAAIKAHREDHDVDLDRLAKIEAEISLFKRKIRIVEEDVIRIRRENDGIYNEIARIRGLTHNEVALKNERRLNVDDLLQRIKLLQTENSARIEQELVFIRRDTTAENRDYFRHELQAAIRDIRADYDQISLRNRNDIEVWYREQIRKIQAESANRPNIDLYKEELSSIRSTVLGVKSRLAEVESRNFFLERLIADLKQSEEAKLYEISLAEKDAAIARLREQCTELSIQMEKLCDNEPTLRAEIERYRVLLNGANVTTYVSNTPNQSYAGTTRVVSQTTRTHSSSNTSYSGVPASRSGGITIGGNIGGISVGGTVGATSTSAQVTGGSVEKRTDRVHDDKGIDENGREYQSWYLGTISINKVTPQFIELKNICKIRRVDVGGFRVEQKVNGILLGSAQINVPLILDPQETIKFYNAHQKQSGSFFMDVDKFDISTNVRTSLYNYTEPDEERGWFVFLN